MSLSAGTRSAEHADELSNPRITRDFGQTRNAASIL